MSSDRWLAAPRPVPDTTHTKTTATRRVRPLDLAPLISIPTSSRDCLFHTILAGMREGIAGWTCSLVVLGAPEAEPDREAPRIATAELNRLSFSLRTLNFINTERITYDMIN